MIELEGVQVLVEVCVVCVGEFVAGWYVVPVYTRVSLLATSTVETCARDVQVDCKHKCKTERYKFTRVEHVCVLHKIIQIFSDQLCTIYFGTKVQPGFKSSHVLDTKSLSVIDKT
jgi:hypothetical protein